MLNIIFSVKFDPAFLHTHIQSFRFVFLSNLDGGSMLQTQSNVLLVCKVALLRRGTRADQLLDYPDKMALCCLSRQSFFLMLLLLLWKSSL